MPRVKIDTTVVTNELEAGEKSIEDLADKAMVMFEQATKTMKDLGNDRAFGFSQDKRWSADHRDGKLGGGFGQVQA